MRRKLSERGFSLLEIMIASSIMMILVLGLYQLIVNLHKTTGDVEKRQRYHDLVDDVRFVLSPTLCRVALHVPAWTENSEAEVNLNGKAVVRAGTLLKDYGLKVNRLYLSNVQSLPVGADQVSSTLADLYIDASAMGSNRPLKPVKVSRILHTRNGTTNEEGCYGSHDIMSRTFSPGVNLPGQAVSPPQGTPSQPPAPGSPAPGAPASGAVPPEMAAALAQAMATGAAGMPGQAAPPEGAGTPASNMPTTAEITSMLLSGNFDLSAMTQKMFMEAEGSPPPAAPNTAPIGIPNAPPAANRSEQDCQLDPNLQSQASRFRIIQGEVHRYRDAQQQLVELTCRNGKLSSVIIDESGGNRGSPVR